MLNIRNLEEYLPLINDLSKEDLRQMVIEEAPKLNVEWSRAIINEDGSTYIEYPSTCATLEEAQRGVDQDDTFNMVVCRYYTDWLYEVDPNEQPDPPLNSYNPKD